MSAFCVACSASSLAIRGTRSMIWVESSGGGMGTSRIDVRREAVKGYELAEERMIDRILDVSSVVGTSFESIDWNKSGYLESEGIVRTVQQAEFS